MVTVCMLNYFCETFVFASNKNAQTNIQTSKLTLAHMLSTQTQIHTHQKRVKFLAITQLSLQNTTFIQAHIHTYISRLTVVSRAAKQSRMSDTTVCYIHERSILIERSLKACYKKIPYEKTTRVTRTTSYH